MDLCFQTNHAQPSFNSRLREVVCALPVPWKEILLIADGTLVFIPTQSCPVVST